MPCRTGRAAARQSHHHHHTDRSHPPSKADDWHVRVPQLPLQFPQQRGIVAHGLLAGQPRHVLAQHAGREGLGLACSAVQAAARGSGSGRTAASGRGGWQPAPGQADQRLLSTATCWQARQAATQPLSIHSAQARRLLTSAAYTPCHPRHHTRTVVAVLCKHQHRIVLWRQLPHQPRVVQVQSHVLYGSRGGQGGAERAAGAGELVVLQLRTLGRHSRQHCRTASLPMYRKTEPPGRQYSSHTKKRCLK